MRLQLLAFSGMKQRTPASGLRPNSGVVALREANNLDPADFPVLVPRKVLRYVHEDASGNVIWPFRKEAQVFP